jgi:hypothetical protein
MEGNAVLNLVQPHGGKGLKALLVPQAERAEALIRAGALRKIPMTSREVSDVLMLAMGAYTPLDGFMGEADWRGVSLDMKLENGVFWPIPITLSCDQELADSILDEEEVALTESIYPGQSNGPCSLKVLMSRWNSAALKSSKSCGSTTRAWWKVNEFPLLFQIIDLSRGAA